MSRIPAEIARMILARNVNIGRRRSEMEKNELRIFVEMLKLLMENEELKKRIEELEDENNGNSHK